MTAWIETAQQVLGSEFDELLLHSAKIYRVIQARGERMDTGRLREWMSYYLAQPYTENPGRFFSFPRKAPEAKVVWKRPYADGRVRTYAFPSRYRVRNPAFRETFESYARNRTSYLVHWTHGKRGRKTILCCHGWSLGDPAQAERMFRISRLFGLGLDVALFITPFHWKRAESMSLRFSPPFPFRHPVLGLEGLGQAMHDLAASCLLLKDRGASRIGMIGASLGGYLTALFVSLTRMAEIAALVVPLVSFHSLRIPVPPYGWKGPGGGSASRLGKDVAALWKIHSPLSHTCKIPPGNAILIASKGDRLCPFEDVERLYRHWGEPEHAFLRGGHTFFFPRSARGEAWYRFLDGHGFI